MPWEPKSMGQENMDGNSPNTSGFSSKTGGTGQESVDHLEGNELQIREPAEEQNTLHKVDLNEIKKLPKRNWYLCNNSFLIHGYFNYHHLIIHETVRNGCKKSYLGVPGVFERPEHTMALLFGFPEFISEQDLLKNQEKETESDDYPEGTFGYWLCLLDL